MKYTFFHDSYVKGSGFEPLRPSPCMSVDYFPVTKPTSLSENSTTYKVATAVMSENVKIWDFCEDDVSKTRASENGDVAMDGTKDSSASTSSDEHLSLKFQLVAELVPSSECKTINIVRWSPDGLFLATGCSSGHVLIWKRHRFLLPEEKAGNLEQEGNENETIDPSLRPSELWRVHKTFKNHEIDVLDLAWSPPMLDTTGTVYSLLTVVSFDNKVSVVNPAAGETVQEFKGAQRYHKSPVQGCAWDPWGSFFATQSCDRTARLFNCNQRSYALQQPTSNSRLIDDNVFTIGPIMKKCEFSEVQFLPKEKCTDDNLKRNFLLFKEENSKIHNRRLDVAPDGSILVVPAGQFPNVEIFQESGGKKVEYQDVIFTFIRNNWKSPRTVHPGHNYPVTGVRFSPVLYKKDNVKQGTNPYWMMFAAVSKDRLLVYSTEHDRPLYVAHLMHQEMLTDVSWSPCGQLLFVSSWDGYFSVYKFESTDAPEGYSLEQFDISSIPDCDSENIHSHKILAGVKRAFNMKAQNLSLLFASLKAEPQEQSSVKVLQVKRKN